MEAIISNLVSQFEKGALNRRQLVRGLAMLAATGTAARAAQNDIDFKTADIDHVSIQVTDLQRSVDFYKKMFDFSVVSEDKPLGIVRLGTNRTLVSLNRQRDQSPVRTETNDSERLVLADDGEVEHFLIEVDGTLQVRNLNADMVDVRGLEIDIVLGSSGRRSAGCQHRETSNQLPAAEGALLELAHKIGNDPFHDDVLSLRGKLGDSIL